MQMAVGRISALMNPVTYVIINLGMIVLIYVGALQVDGGHLTQGQVVALVNYISQILVELIKLANLIVLIAKALSSANRVNDIFEIQSSMADEGKAEVSEDELKAPILEFENVDFNYEGAGAESLTGIDFSVYPGETVGIIGGTGSGKTTLVNLIPRFYDATRGTVRYHGKPIDEYPLEALRQKIGVVPQKAVLFSGTIRDNLRWGNENATDDEILSAVEIAQASDVVRAKDGGLDAVVEQGGRNFSGGQRQRLTIARALVKNPDILILDDSASALDFATDAQLRKAIRENCDDMTVFIVSQRASSVRYADKIIVLDDGEAVGIGTHDELIDSCEVYREIYESQFRKEDAVNG